MGRELSFNFGTQPARKDLGKTKSWLNAEQQICVHFLLSQEHLAWKRKKERIIQKLKKNCSERSTFYEFRDTGT
jgi:hypothetical protein